MTPVIYPVYGAVDARWTAEILSVVHTLASWHPPGALRLSLSALSDNLEASRRVADLSTLLTAPISITSNKIFF
jgi:hypothetical protein